MKYIIISFLLLIIFSVPLYSQVFSQKNMSLEELCDFLGIEYLFAVKICLHSIPETIPINQTIVPIYKLEYAWCVDIYDDEKKIYKLAASHIRMESYLPKRVKLNNDEIKVNFYEYDKKGKGIAIGKAYRIQGLQDSCFIFSFPISPKIINKLYRLKDPSVVFRSWVVYGKDGYKDETEETKFGEVVFDKVDYDLPSHADIVNATIYIVDKNFKIVKDLNWHK